MRRRRSAARADIDATAACIADGVSKVYGGRDTAVRALRDVSLRIGSGALTAIMGPSGSGKSTLLHCLAALDTPTSGRVFLGRTELTALSRRQQAQVRRDRIGFVFQAFNLVPTLDAIENITLPQLLAGRRPDRQWLDFVVGQIGLSDRLHHRPSELSGGQQQRVALARALAGRPEVIFADEPTGNLDTTASGELLMLLRNAVDQYKQTVVIVTHDPTIAAHADRILFFTDGRVVDETDRPDVDHVLARLGHLNEIGGATGGGHRPDPADGQDSMRSRRRRQHDEQTPGRPMVGSDDEVEVARQERWLRRIRQQFEAEHAATEGDEDAAYGGGWTTAPAIEGGLPPAHPAALEPAAHADGATAPSADGSQTGGDVAGAMRAPSLERDAEATLDAAGWLPAERSWAELGAGELSAGEFGARELGAGELGADEPTHSTDDRDTAPSEPVPWSRPAIEPWTEQHETRPPAPTGPASEFDPWAPPDRSTAAEYHNGAGGARRSRGRRSTADERWTTSPPPSSGHVDDQRDETPTATPDADGASVAGYDDRQAPPPEEQRADAAVRHAAAANGDPRANGARPADVDAEPHRQHPRADDRERRDHTPVWEPPAHEEQRGNRYDAHTDPWSDVWDADDEPDVGSVWSPEFDAGLPAFDDDAPNGPPAATDDDRAAGQWRSGGTDDPDPAAARQHTDADDDPPATPHHPEPNPPTPPHRSHADDDPPATPHHPEPNPPTPDDAPPLVTANGNSNGERARSASARDRARTRDAAIVPPALASLRSPRRPDAPADPLEALQSLQAQLERLGTARRPARPGAAPPGAGASGSDTDRRERR